MKVTKLDMAEALVGDPMSLVRFDRGEIAACVGWVPYRTEGGIPLILRKAETKLSVLVPVFKAGTTRDEAKKALCDAVDRIFDAVENLSGSASSSKA